MKPQIYQNCKLYYFDRKLLEFGTINPDIVKAELINGLVEYSLINPTGKDFIIVQAMNSKKASAKMLTLILRKDAKRNCFR